MSVTTTVPKGRDWLITINSNFSKLDDLNVDHGWKETGFTAINGWTYKWGGYRTWKVGGRDFLEISMHLDAPSGGFKPQTSVDICKLPLDAGYGHIVMAACYLQNSQSGNTVNAYYNSDHRTLGAANTTGTTITVTSGDFYVIASN